MIEQTTKQNDKWPHILSQYKYEIGSFLGTAECKRAVKRIIDKIQYYKRILLVANGGSNSVILHFEEDCSKMAGIPCLTLSSPCYITCLGNDCGFDQIFVEWLKSQKQEGDLIIAISSSGESPDIINAARYVRAAELITLTGFNVGNTLSKLGAVNVHVPIKNYGLVENLHSIILHVVLDALIAEQKDTEQQMEYCKITLDYSPEPVWKFPPDHFVTYGKEDEEWAKGLNFGEDKCVSKQHVFYNAILTDCTYFPNNNLQSKCSLTFVVSEFGEGNALWKF